MSEQLHRHSEYLFDRWCRTGDEADMAALCVAWFYEMGPRQSAWLSKTRSTWFD